MPIRAEETFYLACDEGSCNTTTTQRHTSAEAVGRALANGWMIHAHGWISCPEHAGVCDQSRIYGHPCLCRKA